MGQAPNKIDVVRRVAEERADLFRVAHVDGHPQRHDFIKLLAATLHAEDARFGLNGKRGNPDDLSMDVITFRVGPTDRHVEAFDVIGGAGGSNPQPGWSDITNYATMGQPGTAVWIRPEGAPAPQPGPTPQPTPAPQPSCNCKPELDRVASALVALTSTVAAHASVVAGLSERLDEEWAAQVWVATRPDADVVVKLPDFPEYQGRVLGQSFTLRPVKKEA